MTTYSLGSEGATAGGAEAWAALTDYAESQLVVNDGNLYRALAEFTSGAVFDATDFELLASGAQALPSPQITGLLGLPVLGARVETMDHNLTQDHSSYDTPAGIAAATQATYEIAHLLVKDAGEIRFVYVNTGAVSVTVRCGLGLAQNGATISQGYFDGTKTVVIEPGGYAVSDALPCDQAAGTLVYERTWVQASSGAWKITAVGSNGGTAAEIGVDKTGSGILASTTSIRPFMSFALIGPSAGSTLVGLFGDSIVWGSSDTIWGTGRGLGFMARACIPDGIPLLNLGKPSETAQQIATDVTIRGPRWRFFGAAGKAVLQYGINDLNAGRTATQVAGDLLAIGTMLSRRGVVVYQCTITPKSTSSDSFATTANQTPSNPPLTHRPTSNAWIRDDMPIDVTAKTYLAAGSSPALRAGQDGHPFADIFDTAAPVEAGEVWKAPLAGTATTTNASPNLTLVTGSGWAVGMAITGTGIPAGSYIGSIAGTTIGLVNAAAASVNATASASGVAIASGAFTSDGLHPLVTGYAAIAAVVDTTKLT